MPVPDGYQVIFLESSIYLQMNLSVGACLTQTLNLELLFTGQSSGTVAGNDNAQLIFMVF